MALDMCMRCSRRLKMLMSMIWIGFWIKNMKYMELGYNSCMFQNCCMVFSQIILVCMRQKGSIQIQWAEKSFLCSLPGMSWQSIRRIGKSSASQCGKICHFRSFYMENWSNQGTFLEAYPKLEKFIWRQLYNEKNNLKRAHKQYFNLDKLCIKMCSVFPPQSWETQECE